MEDGTPAALRGSRGKSINVQNVLPVFLAALLLTAAFALADVVLVGIVHHHRTETATVVFNKAMAAREQGRSKEALELFRRALNENPANVEYQLAFAQALRAVGSVRESQEALGRLLSTRPAHAGANAELARLLAAKGEWQNAAWYYHRALYGESLDEKDVRKLRFELASLLAKHAAREELLAEVLLLTATPVDPSEARQLAQLFLAAEDWPRAEREYRSLLRKAPVDPNLLTGLARAQMGSGRYVAAERTLRRAAKLGPTAAKELSLLEEVNRLDPTLRGLDASEKHRRAHELATRLATTLSSCAPQSELVVEAQRALGTHVRVRNPLASADTDLDEFERLWQARHDLCPTSPALPREIQMLGAQLSK